jgi:hypothetical protein
MATLEELAFSQPRELLRDHQQDVRHLECRVDISAETGDGRSSGSAWAQITPARHRYARVLVEAQKAATSYYEVGGIIMELLSLCPAGHSLVERAFCRPTSTPTARELLGLLRHGPNLEVTISKADVATRDRLRAGMERCKYGILPFAFVPDASKPTVWFPAYVVGRSIRWRSPTAELRGAEPVGWPLRPGRTPSSTPPSRCGGS